MASAVAQTITYLEENDESSESERVRLALGAKRNAKLLRPS